MNQSSANQALSRLTANQYPNTPEGREAHRLDVVILRVALRDIPGSARRWKWLSRNISKETLRDIINARFRAPHRAYVAELEDTLDGVIARDPN